MSKFKEIIEQYRDILDEYTTENTIDLTVLDKASGETIKNGLREILGNDDDTNKIIQGILNSKSITQPTTVTQPNTNTQPNTQSTTGTQSTTSTQTTSTNPLADTERTAVKQPIA